MENKFILKLLSRNQSFLSSDYKLHHINISKKLNNKRIIILGGAGSIGSAVVKEILNFSPANLHIVDINENNLVELIRNIRATKGYTDFEIKTYVLDIGQNEFKAMVKQNKGYDIWMNFVALKHVRSEKDAFTLMHMVNTNIVNLKKTLDIAIKTNAKKYFSVSSDKAADPVNFMGATKALMEMVLKYYSKYLNTSSARFGNVAFSEGSILDNTKKRLEYKQPIVSPLDIKRYFITPNEAARISILAALFISKGNTFIPILNKKSFLKSFLVIIRKYVDCKGYKLKIITNEKEARNNVNYFIKKKQWPCFVFNTNTSGEKKEEIFIGNNEKIIKTKFKQLDMIKINTFNEKDLTKLFLNLKNLKKKQSWEIEDIKIIFEKFLPNFKHYDLGKNLDNSM